MEKSPQRSLDQDLERLARASGRPTIAAGAATAFAVVSVVTIDLVYGGRPTVLAYLAVAVIIWFVAPGLVVAGVRHRRAVYDWARDQQRLRDEAEPEGPRPRKRRAVGSGRGEVTPLHGTPIVDGAPGLPSRPRTRPGGRGREDE